MDVRSVSGQQSSPAPSTVGKTTAITAESGRDTFLRLLVAQLEHQDPLSPMENADFTAQLAQFSTLEQIEKMNTHLSSLVQAQEALNRMQTNMQAASLIGKEVKVQGNTMHVQEGKASPVSYSLAAYSPKVTIQIVNESGSIIQTLEELNKGAGEHAVPQHSGADSLSRLPDGKYTVVVTARDGAGQPVSAQTLIQGRVDGVEYKDNRPYFLIGGNKLEFDAVVSVQAQE